MIELMLAADIPKLPQPISYKDSMLMTGSCFTEHMSERLAQHKFTVLSNPHGILFNPLSVAETLDGYITGKLYTEDDLFFLNELWNSWDHHTRFSNPDKTAALRQINESQTDAAAFIRQAGWVMITLGSAFQYYLKEGDRPVANNHRAPAQWFEKKLLSTDVITDALSATVEKAIGLNSDINFLFTISPVRHIRDGVIDNNRSKARLIEAVHRLCERFPQAHYFPAYELVIDILRDYRYYDIDFVHPNYLATQFVWDQFVNSCIAPPAKEIMARVQDIMMARSHRPRFPGTKAHKKFLDSYAEKARSLQQQYPFLRLEQEIRYFSGQES